MVRDPIGDGSVELSLSGVPTRPLVVLELDDLAAASTDEIERMGVAIQKALPLVVGVLRTEPPAALYPLLTATSVTITDLPKSDRFAPTAVKKPT